MTFDIDYDKAEFVGQIVDTFEDYFTDNNIIWPNPDRDAEESVSDDITNTAIIYGLDYDVITNDVEYFLDNNYVDGELFNKEDIDAISLQTFNNTLSLLDKIEDSTDKNNAINKMNADKDTLIDKIIDTFVEWELYTRVYYVRFSVRGHYEAEVKDATSLSDAITKAETMFSEANFEELTDIDGYYTRVEDENGNTILEDN